MATTKVSELSALTSPDGAEELLINDSGTSKKITLDNVTENNFTDTLKTKLDAIEASATADQTAGEILTLLEDGIDSVHYKDGSIDNEHIADNAIDSEHYAAGSIDLEHMSSESVDEDNLHISNAGSNGNFLSKQSGNAGGMTWAEVDALPSQSGHSGKFLTTDATDASWATIATGNTTTSPMWEMAHTVSTNYTMTTNYNGVSVAPVTINSGISVTVPTGSTWTIV